MSRRCSLHVVFIAIALLAGLVAAVRPASAANAIVLRLHHFLGADSMVQKKLLKPWAKEIEKRSKGRLKIEIHPEMELGGKDWDLIYQVKTGKVDLVWTAAAYTPKLFRASQVFTLPLVHQGDAVVTSLAMAKMLDVELKRDFIGLHPLLAHVHSGHVFHTTKAVKKLSDLKGMTIRPPGKNAGLWTLKELGATPARKRHPSLELALRHHALDGVLMSPALADSMGVLEAASHQLAYGPGGSFGTSLYLLLMNEKSYNSLPPELRKVIDESAGEKLAIRAGKIWQKAGEAAMQKAMAAGHPFEVVPESEKETWRTRLTRAMSRWTKFLDPRSTDSLMLIQPARSAIRASARQLGR